MGQPVEQRAGEPLVAEDLGPLAEGQIGRDDDRPSLLSFTEDTKEQLRIGSGEREVGELIEDEDINSGVAIDNAGELSAVLC